MMACWNQGAKRVLAILLAAVLPVVGCATDVSGSAAGSSGPLVAQARGSDVNIQNRSGEESELRRRARIRLELAISYFQEGRHNVALDELKQSLDIDPTYADAIGVLALVYMELGERALAEQSFRRAMQLQPNDSDLNVNYGWFLCSTGRERESIDFFMAALKNPLYQRPALPLQNAGVCALRIRDVAAAEGYLKRSFEMQPGGIVAPVGLARIYYDRGDFERARFYVRNVNRSESAYPESIWLGLKIERKLGNQAEEASLAAQLRRAFPNSPEAAALARAAYDE